MRAESGILDTLLLSWWSWYSVLFFILVVASRDDVWLLVLIGLGDRDDVC